MLKKTLSIALALIIILGLSSFAAPEASAALVATPTASTVMVNGSTVAFDAYNIGGSNYFKLRDLAYTINGTAKQFEVGWDSANNAIRLTSGRPYTPDKSEMSGKGTGNKTPRPTSSKIYLDGRAVSFTAYNIEGNNYFKLRDIGETFNFGVDWDAANKIIAIDTAKGYTPEGGGTLTLGDYISKSAPITTSKLLENYSMTEAERKCYDQLAAGITKLEITIEVTPISHMSAQKVIWILNATLIDVFWWGGGTYFAENNGIVTAVCPKYFYNNKFLCGVDESAMVFYTPPASVVAEAKAWIESGKAAVRNAINSMPMQAGMTPCELELAIHDWFSVNTKYEFNEGRGHEQLSSMYEAIINGRANCVGYTKAFQYIVSLLGIECHYINGVNNTGILHAWNAVKLDGEWYHVDVSSDSASSEYYGSLHYYYFFNRSDKYITDFGFIIGGSDYPSGVNPNIACTATKYAYENIT